MQQGPELGSLSCVLVVAAQCRVEGGEEFGPALHHGTREPPLVRFEG